MKFGRKFMLYLNSPKTPNSLCVIGHRKVISRVDTPLTTFCVVS